MKVKQDDNKKDYVYIWSNSYYFGPLPCYLDQIEFFQFDC